MRHSRTRRFTLIELLVVIAIIAVLAAFLLPAITKAKSRALEISCMSQQKQLYLGMVMYRDDNDESMPSPWPIEYTYMIQHRTDMGGGRYGPTGLGCLYRERYLTEGAMVFCPDMLFGDGTELKSTTRAATLRALAEIADTGTTSTLFYQTQSTYRVNVANSTFGAWQGLGGTDTDDEKIDVYNVQRWQTRAVRRAYGTPHTVAGIGDRWQNNDASGNLSSGSVGSPLGLVVCAFSTSNRGRYLPHRGRAAIAIYVDGTAATIRPSTDPGIPYNNSSLWTPNGGELGKFTTSVNLSYPGGYTPPK